MKETRDPFEKLIEEIDALDALRRDVDLFDVALADMLDRYRSTPQEGPLRNFAESIVAGMESEGRSDALPKTVGKMRRLSGRLR